LADHKRRKNSIRSDDDDDDVFLKNKNNNNEIKNDGFVATNFVTKYCIMMLINNKKISTLGCNIIIIVFVKKTPRDDDEHSSHSRIMTRVFTCSSDGQTIF
jgi:hypothetical protein